MNKYKVPKGTTVDRYRQRYDVSGIPYGKWETFVTTKDAYYTDADIIEEVKQKASAAVVALRFGVPHKRYTKIEVLVEFLELRWRQRQVK